MMLAPCPSAPSRLAAGTTQSSNTSSPSGLPRKPILSSFCATLKPSKPRSTRKALMPRLPSSGAVLAYTRSTSATGPLVIHIFVPLSL